MAPIQAAGWLWALVVGRAQLARHLAALKSYFLLGRGDFWQAFLLEARAAPSSLVPNAALAPDF
jgi:gamma-tubulin complex component 4